MTLAAILCAAYGADDTTGGHWDAARPTPSAPSMLDAADAVVVERIRSGDRGAFDALFLEHFAALRHFAARYIGAASAAEIVSESFLRLWLARETWAPRWTIRAYLYNTVRRLAIDGYRSTRAERQRYATTLGPEEVWGMASPTPSPESAVETEATIALVWQAIRSLSEVQQSVMALRWQAQLSWDEVASAVGMSAVAVRKQHSRALARLRELLPAHLTDE